MSLKLKHMITNIVRTLVMALVLTVSSACAVQAQHSASAVKPNGTEIRYAGSNHDFINFEVSVKGNQRQTLRIFDENGVELYRESIGKGELTRMVKILRNDYARLNFVVDSPNGQYRKAFNIKAELIERLNVEEVN